MDDGRSVLIVERDAALRELAARVLEGEGYRAVVAPDGAAALALTRGDPPPAVVLLDPQLGDAGAFVRSYRRAGAGAALVLLFTTWPGPAAAALAEEVGADGFVVKPFDLDTLLETVGRCAAGGGEGTGCGQ